MQRHMLRTMVAAVATAGAALLTVGAAGATSAGAATHYPVITTTSHRVTAAPERPLAGPSPLARRSQWRR